MLIALAIRKVGDEAADPSWAANPSNKCKNNRDHSTKHFQLRVLCSISVSGRGRQQKQISGSFKAQVAVRALLDVYPKGGCNCDSCATREGFRASWRKDLPK